MDTWKGKENQKMENQLSQPPLPCFRIFLCGAFRVEKRVGEHYELIHTADWGGSNYPRLLLKALLCCPGRQARRDSLLDLLWPEADFEQATVYLNTATTKLRRLLRSADGPESLLFTENEAAFYRLADQTRLWVDADEGVALFKEAERRGRTSPEALPLLEQAAAYFTRGSFLQEEEGLWAAGRRASVEQVRSSCRLWLAESYAQHGLPGQAATVLQTLLEEDPLDEDVLARLMELWHQQGMTHQAQRLYEQSCQVLAREGLEPSKATRTLAARLREERHIPSLISVDAGQTTPDGGTLRMFFGPSNKTTSSPPVTQIIGETRLPERDFMDQLRRQILKGTGAALLASQDLEFGVELTERLVRALTRTSFIEEKTLSYLERRIEQYWQDRNAVSLPASALVSYILEDLRRMTILLEGSLTPAIRVHLCSIIGMAAMLVGELYYDMKDYSRARTFQNMAIIAAQDANNAVLEAVAWGRNSFAWTYDENFTEARNVIQQARYLARRGNNTVRAWLAAVEAEIQSNLADREACLQALKEAAAVEDWKTSQGDCYWIYFDQSLLAGYQGISLLRLSNQGHKALVQNAQIALQDALSLLDPSMKRREPTLLIDLAGTYVQQGEIEQACGYAVKAIDAIKRIDSKVVFHRLLTLRNTLTPWRETRFVQDLDGYIESLHTLAKHQEQRML